jgi:hypothetical protein
VIALARTATADRDPQEQGKPVTEDEAAARLIAAGAAGVMDVTAEQVCPPSSVADMIVHWDEVRTGDLVLGFRGELGVATTAPHGNAWVPEGRVSLVIDGVWYTPRKDRLTAVRRYITGE